MASRLKEKLKVYLILKTSACKVHWMVYFEIVSNLEALLELDWFKLESLKFSIVDEWTFEFKIAGFKSF